ncbi:unnamed protein product [Lasius platythorax]|uniref:Uncharacterized protein n=1 Tax=Lasius platythorax TaxID=488582 RepID=A0AAV2NEA3_9HYME
MSGDLNRNSSGIPSSDTGGTWNKVTRRCGTVLINVDRRCGATRKPLPRHRTVADDDEGTGGRRRERLAVGARKIPSPATHDAISTFARERERLFTR